MKSTTPDSALNDSKPAKATSLLSPHCTDGSIALLYVGSVLPDLPAYHSSAFSRAGAMFQANLLLGLKHAGMRPSKILSYRQVQSFPGSRQIWVNAEKTSLDDEMPVILLPFLNITPIKQLMLGFASFIQIICWGWKNRYKSRIVYTFNLTVPPGIFTLAGARLIGAKAVVSLNDINKPGHTVPDTLFNRLDFKMQRKLIPLFDGHIAVADNIMRDFAPNRPYVRIEGGITDDVIGRLAATDGSAKDYGTFTIVSAGSLDEANGFRVLLEAFALLDGDSYRLCIAGCGPLEEEIKAAATKDRRIDFRGYLSHADVLSLYKSADLLINLRLTKAINTLYFFPSKLMEYLASGTPVISTCTGHVEEEYSSYLYLLKEETPSSLAKLIDTIASLPPEKRAEKATRAQRYMSLNKTWDAQGRRIVDFMKNLFTSKGK